MPLSAETFFTGKSVLVTGADGFIGSHLTETLLSQGANVRALAAYNAFGSSGWLDDLSSDNRASIEIVRGDIRDPAYTDKIVQDMDIVFHLAALIAIPFSYDAPQSYIDVNLTGTVNIMEACRRHKVTRMVHTSTSEVYGTALFTPITELHPMQGQSPYSASKIAADHMVEAYVKSFDFPGVILRPFNTYGPRQSERAVIPTIIRQMLDPNCETVKIGSLDPTRDFNYVMDTVSAFLTAGGHPSIAYGTAYNAGSGVAVSIGQTVDILKEIMGCNKQVVTDQGRFRPANSEVMTLLADSQKLNTATSWKSDVTLQSGLEMTVNWWKDRIAKGLVRPDANYLL